MLPDTTVERCVLFAMTSPYGISRSVLSKAIQLAKGLGAELELFYRAFDSAIVHPDKPGVHQPVPDIRAYVEERQRQLQTLAEELRATGLRVTARVEWDTHSDDGIIREVLRRQPTFLVIESFPKTPADGVLYYQNHHRLIESCPCPLLLIRSAQPYPAHPRVLAAVDPMHAHAKTAALDDAIVTAACKISAALSAEVHLFHARAQWAKITHQIRGPDWIPDVLKVENQVVYEASVQSQLAELARLHSLPVQRLHLVDGDVRDCLPSFIQADAVDILTLGALSRSVMQRILLGETALRLLDRLDCDMLIVKPPGFHCPVARA
jgi:universal stress protein E